MRGVVRGTIGQVKPRGVVKGCDQLCKRRRGGGQRLKWCTPAVAAEIGCDCGAQINDSHDVLAPRSQQRQRGRLLTLKTPLFPHFKSTSTLKLPHMHRPAWFMPIPDEQGHVNLKRMINFCPFLALHTHKAGISSCQFMSFLKI